MSNDDRKRAIGKVVTVAADRFVVEMHAGTDNFTVVGFDDVHYVARLGSFLMIMAQSDYVVVEVIGLRERDVAGPDERSDFDRAGSSKFLDVVPVGMLPVRGGTGLGKPLRSILHPVRTDLPIVLAAQGPKNVALSAEICDGWLPLFFSPKEDGFYRRCLQDGFATAGDSSKVDRFEVVSNISIVPGDDIERCADVVRPSLALYVGGMGARGANFHFEVFTRMGYEDVALRVQELYLAGKKAEAAAAIPLRIVEDVALIGPPDKIRGELDKWNESCINTFLVAGPKRRTSTRK